MPGSNHLITWFKKKVYFFIYNKNNSKVGRPGATDSVESNISVPLEISYGRQSTISSDRKAYRH